MGNDKLKLTLPSLVSVFTEKLKIYQTVNRQLILLIFYVSKTVNIAKCECKHRLE